MIACLHLYSTERMPEIRVAFLQALEKYTFLISMLPYKFKKRNNGMKFGAEVLALSCGKNTIKSLHEKLISETRRITEAKDFGMAIVDGLGESGYYGWKELKYFLYEYECSLKAKAKRKSDKIDWETFIGDDYDEDHSSIEHILPQTPVAPYWKEQIAGLSTSQVKKLTNSLGNLLATSQPRNSSLRNAPFPEKKGGSSKKTGYKYGGYSEIEVATNSDWGPSDILSRGLAMLEFLEQRWGTKFGADSDARAKILGIEFLTKPTKNSGSSTPTP
jgi:hypothetical protein